MAKAHTNDSNNDKSKVPDWLVAEIFEDLLKNNVDGYETTLNFRAFSAMPPGENYSTTMLRIEIDLELKGKNTQLYTYVRVCRFPNKKRLFM